MSALTNIKFHYFPFPGRGGFVKLLLEDAGLDYETVTIRFRDWPKKKSELVAEGIPIPSLPYLTVDGKYIGKTFPTMRYLSKQLGYLGENDLENQYLDSLSDICLAWYQSWSIAYVIKKSEEAEKKYQTTTGVMHHDSFENILVKSGGPYILGNKITYVDFIVYHILLEDTFRKNIDNNDQYPGLKKLINAIESRPNLKKYLSKL